MVGGWMVRMAVLEDGWLEDGLVLVECSKKLHGHRPQIPVIEK